MKKLFFSNEEKNLFKKTLNYIKPYRLKFILTFIVILTGVICGIIQPIIWAKFLVNLFSKNFNNVIQDISWLVLLYTIQLVFNFIQAYFFAYLSNSLVYDLKKDMFKKILELQVKAFDEKGTGEYISRMHQDTANISSLITNELLMTFIELIKVIMFGCALFKINIILALITICSFPVSYIIFFVFGRKIRDYTSKLLKCNDKYFNSLQQALSGIREIKIFNLGHKISDSFNNDLKKIKSKQIQISVLNSLGQTLSQGFNFFTQILIMVIGAYFIIQNHLKVEYFIAFSSYSSQIIASLGNITRINSLINEALSSMERIFELMDNLAYSNDKFGHLKIEEIEGNLKFDNVSFAYENNKKILNGVTFSVNSNKKVAIVGNSGSGKTTLFNLLLRFYNLNDGNIFIDNLNIKDLDEYSLRKHIAVVRQDPYLFNISIRDNLLLSNPDASDEDIIKACKDSYIHDYIESLPDGYNTIIEDNCSNFSRGQVQRIAIARALLRKTKILLFDEATSALDNQSQSHIKDIINKLSQEHTIIFIAHRLSTITDMDEIIFLNGGKVEDKGSFEYLVRKNANFKKLYLAEFKDSSDILEAVVEGAQG